MSSWTFTVATGIAAWQRPADAHGRRYTPTRVIESERSIGWAAQAAGVPRLGRRRIGLEVLLAQGTRGDVDNRAKTVMDALEKCRVVANDQQIDELIVRRRLPVGAMPIVTVYELTADGNGPAPPEERNPTAAPGSNPKTESPSRVLPES